ncbi:MAG TPA: serine hydrolase domain-containing protein [Chryseosolibacter sp.]
MKFKLLTLAFVSLTCLACGQVSEKELSDKIDKLAKDLAVEGKPGFTVAVAKADRILFSKGYGSANPEYDINNSPASIFHVASVSKQFTAFAIALLADQGKISLNDDIRKYLPELKDFGHTITIRHLVHHTSGLRDQWNLLALAGWRLDDVITKDQVLRLISRQDELNFKPRDEFSYCNTGYTLMAEIVSRVTGTTFAGWCKQNIFEPLQMNNTLFYDDHEKVVKNRAYSFHDSPDGIKKSVLSYANAGATSLFTTAEDLVKWSNNFYTMKVGNANVMKQMEERGILNEGDTISYAFGQDMSKYKGVRTIAHSGGDAGYRSYLLRFPEQKYTIVVLGNMASFNPGGLAYKIADVCLAGVLKEEPKKEEAKKTQKEFKVSEALLKLYEGQYQLTPDMVVTVKLDNGTLTARATGQSSFPLTASSESEFVFDQAGIRITFPKPSDNRVSQFVFYQGGTTLVAPRLKPFDPKTTDLAAYVGTYYSPELETSYRITIKDDTLTANHIRHDPTDLTLTARDEFTTNTWFMGKIEFTRDKDSKISGMKVSSGRVKNVRFVKQP